MAVAILFPRFDHPAIEERYASWQSEMLLRREADEIVHYGADETAKHAVRDIESSHVLVVIDPLLLPSPGLAGKLIDVLQSMNAFAAVPVTNEPRHASQRAAIAPYMTLRELQREAAELAQKERGTDRVVWDASDPGAFVCATASLAGLREPLRSVLVGKEVAVARGAFVHRWASLRGQVREDLLDRIDKDARSILEFGCGEGGLGAALKQRQKCRVVGIELDHDAATKARKRLDDVYEGDVLEIVALIHEEFDAIVGGDILEHLAEPWSFLADLRRIARPGGRLLLSLPNVANASIVADLLQGRFDYVYMGIACVGHLRFFTRQSIEDMLDIAGWEVESIEPQQLTVTRDMQSMIADLEAKSIAFSKDDLMPTGFYVIARNSR